MRYREVERKRGGQEREESGKDKEKDEREPVMVGREKRKAI